MSFFGENLRLAHFIFILLPELAGWGEVKQG